MISSPSTMATANPAALVVSNTALNCFSMPYKRLSVCEKANVEIRVKAIIRLRLFIFGWILL